MAEHEKLVIRPPAREWGPLLRSRAGSTSRPLIVTGHQPEFWHPGILAKYLAADAAARVVDGDVLWVVVDQARPTSAWVPYPARVSGRLAKGEALIAGGDTEPAVPDDAAAPFVRDGLDRIIRAMRAHRDPALARRVAGALEVLLAPLLGRETRRRTVFATDLWSDPEFRRLVERMQAEPEPCVRAYNAAVARHPSAGVRALVADEVQDRWELPLWRLVPDGPRWPVYAEDLARIPPEQLAPRALLMTGMLRLAAKNSLFIHGTGGGGGGDDEHEGYDTVTEDWLRDWLGETRLAPVAVVTATKRLPLGVAGSPGPAEVARAKWRAHSARHHPAMLGDAGAESAKLAHVGAIARSPDRHRRETEFRSMHRLLDDYRARNAAGLERLRGEVEEVEGQRSDAAIAADRTWAFPLYPPEELGSLKSEIDRAFGLNDL